MTGLAALLTTGFVLLGPSPGLRFGAPVAFDIYGIGQPVAVSWPAAGYSWLALDANDDHQINDGTELFGDATPLVGLANKTAENGFFALLQYDDNHDDVLDARDRIFDRLLLWTDSNANGRADRGELKSLTAAGIRALKLSFKKVPGTSDDGELLQLLVGSFVTTSGESHPLVDTPLRIHAK